MKKSELSSLANGMIVVGVVCCVTVLGAAVGIPLLILGGAMRLAIDLGG
ncbi:MAG: hypothetical protein QM811_02770 [Pirellulales bacterium]